MSKDNNKVYEVVGSNGIKLVTKDDSNIELKGQYPTDDCNILDDSKECHITIYKPIAGWKAVLMQPSDDKSFMEPWVTSYFAFKTKEEAINYAKDWAEAENVPFKEGGIY
jgi:hypothetical protein